MISLITGVGGHGGAGIHADLESKYREIIQRVSCHATPSALAKDESGKQKQPSSRIWTELVTCRSDTTFYSVGSESHSSVMANTGDQSILAGMGVDSVSMLGTPRQRHPLPSYQSQQQQQQHPHQMQRRNTAEQARNLTIQPQSPTQVEQVHVAKCAVCTILW